MKKIPLKIKSKKKLKKKHKQKNSSKTLRIELVSEPKKLVYISISAIKFFVYISRPVRSSKNETTAIYKILLL